MAYPGKRINFSNPADLLETLKRMTSGQDTSDLNVKVEDAIITNEEIREIEDVAKGQIDEKIAIPLFLEVDKFLREMVVRHFENER